MGSRRSVITVSLAALALAAGLAPGGATATTGAGDGSYTTGQAATGARAFATNCASCHGAKLQGGIGPTLKGSQAPFHGTQHAGDVFNYIRTQMPLGKPGSLAPATYAAILAYLLQQNGHRAGTHVLTPAAAARSREKM